MFGKNTVKTKLSGGKFMSNVYKLDRLSFNNGVNEILTLRPLKRALTTSSGKAFKHTSSKTSKVNKSKSVVRSKD